ncbi:MAG TPA: oligopeptidase B, partial [Edaphobacter sp.]|nr:oligopeptidase B [Edaphobacter sp.]
MPRNANDVSASALTPPVARREPTPTTIHGHTLEDDYRWMRTKESAEVIAYLEAENAYTAAMMKPTEGLQETLYKEMLSHIKETDESVPFRERGWYYYTRTVEGSQYPIHCRRKAVGETYDPAQLEQVILDVNRLAEGQAFMSVGGMSVSPDGEKLAYSTDNTGFRQYTLHIRNLTTGAEYPDTAERVGSLVWAEDSQTLFYTTEDEVTKRQDKLFRHRLGAPNVEDAM